MVEARQIDLRFVNEVECVFKTVWPIAVEAVNKAARDRNIS